MENISSVLIKRRNELGLSQDIVCDGICSQTQYAKYESGKRIPDKLMGDAIYNRLHIDTHSDEYFLNNAEYFAWEERFYIVNALYNDEIILAQSLLEKYNDSKKERTELEKQFALSMEAIIFLYEKDFEGAIELIYKALAITVKDISFQSITRMELSTKEICLLSFYYYLTDIPLIQKREMLDLLLSKVSIYDNIYYKVQVYPLVVFVYDEICLNNDYLESEMLIKLVDHLHNAVELIRESRFTYCIDELFYLNEKIMNYINLHYTKDNYFEIMSKLKDIKKWSELFSSIEETYNVSFCKIPFLHVFFETNVNSFSDVIHRRRLMNNISLDELCDGICSKSTLKSFEAKKTDMRNEIILELMDRLGLNIKKQKNNIISKDIRIIHLSEKLFEAHKLGKFDEVIKYIYEIREIDKSKNVNNIQFLGRMEGLTLFKQKKIERNTYYEWLKNLFSLSVNWQKITDSEAIYLTREEFSILHNILIINQIHPDLFYLNILEEIINYLEDNDYEKHIAEYEFLAISYASLLGNVGRFDESNRINNNVLKLSFKTNRIPRLRRAIYGWFWNREKSGKVQSGETERIIRLCIGISEFTKEENAVKFYKKILTSST